jgi:hypothetical protein
VDTIDAPSLSQSMQRLLSRKATTGVGPISGIEVDTDEVTDSRLPRYMATRTKCQVRRSRSVGYLHALTHCEAVASASRETR